MTADELVQLARSIRNSVSSVIARSEVADEQMSVEMLTAFRTMALLLLEGLSDVELTRPEPALLGLALELATAWLGFKASLRQAFSRVDLDAILKAQGQQR